MKPEDVEEFAGVANFRTQPPGPKRWYRHLREAVAVTHTVAIVAGDEHVIVQCSTDADEWVLNLRVL